MRILMINSVEKGSTGKIMFSVADCVQKYGHEVRCIVGTRKNSAKDNHRFFVSRPQSLFAYYFCYMVGYFTGMANFVGFRTTKKIINEIEKFDPDIIHLHNIHGDFINVKLLFEFLKMKKIKIVWTLHDCWGFTGRCPHFAAVKCNKWSTGCCQCPYPKSDYPRAIKDRTKVLWRLKKEYFTNIEEMTLVTPSKWLADFVKQSFLKDYPVQVINNGIDLAVFKPTESNFREKYNIPAEKYILLGVAFGWGARKGLDVFIELSKHLPDNYQIVLVGTNDKTDKQLPKNIISIHRTQNQTELAEIYSAADLFVNPTREENYTTVNMESLACGTPVLTFRTGGSPEIIDETCGSVVDCDDIDALESEIKRICTEKPYSKDACLARAKAFDMNERYEEYIELYNALTVSKDGVKL